MAFANYARNIMFGVVVIVLLGTGIGANTVIFSFVNSLLLKPLPVRNPGNLFLLEKNYRTAGAAGHIVRV